MGSTLTNYFIKRNDLNFSEVFSEKVKKTSEKNQKIITEKIKKLSNGKIELIENSEDSKFDSPPPIDFLKKDKYYNKK